MSHIPIATWNIRKCIGLDRRRDPHRTARIIASLEADVVAIQEADKRLGSRPAALTPDIVRRETGLRPIDSGGHEASIGWHGNAVLISSQIECEDVHGLHLPGIEPRGALIVDLKRKHTKFRVVAVHLGLLRQSRRQQLATIRSRLEALPERPTAVLGDFNEWSPEHGLEPLQGFDVHTPGDTFHSRRLLAPLDRIAVHGADLKDADVFQRGESWRASDHLPVRARFQPD